MNDRFDCVVIGAGPAGSVAALVASQAGLHTLLVERDREPHAGPAEAVSPPAAELLGRLGAASTPAGPLARRDLVQRLWRAASERGTRLATDTRALQVLFSGEQAAGVRVELPSGAVVEIASSQVINATGHDALLATQLKLKRPELRRQAVIWGEYVGVTQPAAREPAAETCCCHAGCGRATFRLVAQEGDLACLSLVGDADYLLEGRGAPEEIFEDELVNCPSFAERLIQARLVDRFLVAVYRPFTVRESAGEGWRLVGDAREPADPLDPAALSSAILPVATRPSRLRIPPTACCRPGG